MIKLKADAPSIILYVTSQKNEYPKENAQKNPNATEYPHFRHQNEKK